MSRYDGTDHYVYPGTEVLRNKADILDQAVLDAFEADATALRMLELVASPIQGNFDLKHLCGIHRYLFQDVNEWAGEIRTVDISRGDSRFANFGQVETYLSKKLQGLASEKFLRGMMPDSFVARLADYMSEIIAAHPFREGNGRMQRLFCSQLADQARYFIDFEMVDQANIYQAMINNFNGHEKPLAKLLGDITAVIE